MEQVNAEGGAGKSVDSRDTDRFPAQKIPQQPQRKHVSEKAAVRAEPARQLHE